jgi:hypothetical protein
LSRNPVLPRIRLSTFLPFRSSVLRRRPQEEEGGASFVTGQEVERGALYRPSRRNRNVKVKAENHAEPEVSSPADQQEPEEDEGLKHIRDRLMTAYRTLALRDALAQNPDVAFLAAFYRCTSESCVEIDVKSVVFGNQAPGLNDPPLRRPSTTGITVGPSSCRGSRASCGTHSSHSIPTAAKRCSRIAWH